MIFTYGATYEGEEQTAGWRDDADPDNGYQFVICYIITFNIRLSLSNAKHSSIYSWE